MSISGFFDSQHSADLLPLPLHYRLLRRFEHTRERVAADLLDGGDRLLDIGCGDGALIEMLNHRFRAIVGADISPQVVSTAAQAGSSASTRWIVLDASRPLPFEDESFNSLVSLSTLQYIFDPAAFLSEARRLLVPGGHLLVETPNVAYLPQRLRLVAGRPIKTSYWRHGIDGGNLHYFTVDSLLQLLTDSGFEPIRTSGSGVFAALRTWRVSLLCGNIFVLARRR
jgi:SAM-dependent methyltransferase